MFLETDQYNHQGMCDLKIEGYIVCLQDNLQNNCGLLPAQLWPANPVIQIQVPSNELQTPWDGLLQSSGHVRSSITFVESTAVQTCKENICQYIFLLN